ncbi:MAG TPA: hypothetical protein VF570_22285, partial [Pyrinomonadaceae bacterium]
EPPRRRGRRGARRLPSERRRFLKGPAPPVTNYYRTKEAILESIIGRYQKVIDARLRAIFEEVEEPFHPESLRRFGRMVKELVGAHS